MMREPERELVKLRAVEAKMMEVTTMLTTALMMRELERELVKLRAVEAKMMATTVTWIWICWQKVSLSLRVKAMGLKEVMVDLQLQHRASRPGPLLGAMLCSPMTNLPNPAIQRTRRVMRGRLTSRRRRTSPSRRSNSNAAQPQPQQHRRQS